jgi:L-type amino acid transporter 9
VLVIAVALFLCLVPIITDPSPKYFFALLFVGLGIILYVPLVYYKFRPVWMGELPSLGIRINNLTIKSMRCDKIREN